MFISYFFFIFEGENLRNQGAATLVSDDGASGENVQEGSIFLIFQIKKKIYMNVFEIDHNNLHK